MDIIDGRPARGYCQRNPDGSYQGVIHFQDGGQPEWVVQPKTTSQVSCESWVAERQRSGRSDPGGTSAPAPAPGLPSAPGGGFGGTLDSAFEWIKQNPEWTALILLGIVLVPQTKRRRR